MQVLIGKKEQVLKFISPIGSLHPGDTFFLENSTSFCMKLKNLTSRFFSAYVVLSTGEVVYVKHEIEVIPVDANVNIQLTSGQYEVMGGGGTWV
jgi:hypothetical protein